MLKRFSARRSGSPEAGTAVRRGAPAAVLAGLLMLTTAACGADDPAAVSTVGGTGAGSVTQGADDTSDGTPAGSAGNDADSDGGQSGAAQVITVDGDDGLAGDGLDDGAGAGLGAADNADPGNASDSAATTGAASAAANGTGSDAAAAAGAEFVSAPTEEAAEFLADSLRASSLRPVEGRLVLDVAFAAGLEADFAVDADGDTRMRARIDGLTATLLGADSLELEVEMIFGSDGLVYARYLGDDPDVVAEFGDGWIVSDRDDENGLFVDLVCTETILESDNGCAAPNDHSEAIRLINAAEIVGDAVIDGVDTTHVRFTLGGDDAVPDGSIGPDDAALPDLDTPMNAWIGDDGLVRRMALDSDAFSAAIIAAARADFGLGISDDPEEQEAAEMFATAMLEMFTPEISMNFDNYDNIEDIPNPPDGPITPVSGSLLGDSADNSTR